MAEEFDDPYSDAKDSEEGETPTLDQIIADAINARLLEVHTSLPCVVVKVRSNGFVDVQPLLKRKYTDGSLELLPVIPNCPINHPRGADYFIKLPVAVGDTGRASFQERSMDAWIVNGGYVDPDDPRTHDLTDAVFIPGLYPEKDIVPGAAGDMVLKNGSATMDIQKSGKFALKNISNNELFDLLDQTLAQVSLLNQTLNADTTNTIFGPMKLNSFVIYGNIKTAIDAIKAKMLTLKGT